MSYIFPLSSKNPVKDCLLDLLLLLKLVLNIESLGLKIEPASNAFVLLKEFGLFIYLTLICYPQIIY